ncbi:response regulator transcription factor [Chitinophaga nivalis]|uniref:Response regulator transcription factor n=1 Tax=Chitinophaga nivalis TaxID=2991709 RepID=A0ABT3IS38_9BACT|nr:response regulator transcription factor [Chitinophaga nivalis]MCW3463522.1 response regulator transcription factor [Chitinophaga nivalis]MCW3486788.1 response regulator transcription factor [Chitinophaga nivalis]
MINILLIEDEPKVVAFIKKGLEAHRYHVTVAYDGATGRTMALQQDFDLIILDVILPHYNGLEVCSYIRHFKRDLPILMLTALGTLGDKVRGFENGADDYLTKPFHFEELLMRIKALSRRNTMTSPAAVYHADDLEMDCYRRAIVRNGREIMLTVKEFTLLEVLLVNKNRVLSRTEIAEAVWGIDFNRGTNLIDVYINYLRSKVDKGFSKQLIHTVIGVGYVLKD